MTSLDLTKPVQTRDGRPVRILCVDALGDDPVVGLIAQSNTSDWVRRWRLTGEYDYGELRASALDLINVPPKPVKYYVDVYYSAGGSVVLERPYLEGEGPACRTRASSYIKTIEFEV